MKNILITVFALMISISVSADEGMWTFDNFPSARVKKELQVDISPAWLDHARLSSVRLANGCSGSFISSKGLILTNHHCVVGCIQQVSTAKKDFIKNGFLASEQKNELICPALEVNRLLSITNVNEQIKKATKNLKGEAFSKARLSVIADIENKCSDDASKFRCDVITLYNGGLYHLYKYQRYQDVRLVFAPESSVAAFGGDPDNFNFPRYSLDFSFLRVYEDNKPLNNPHYFSWSKQGIQDGQATFITGHPGRTSRSLTVAELKAQRDDQLIHRLTMASELRGLLLQYQKRGKEHKRISHSMLQGIENRLKVIKGQRAALADETFFSTLVKKENDFKNQVNRNPKLKKQYGQTWGEIQHLVKKATAHKSEVEFIMYNTFGSRLFRHALTLVQASEELKKDNSDRLKEYTDSRLPQMTQGLFSKAPIYKDLEENLMEFHLLKTREALSPDHAFVKKILGNQSPEQMAQHWVRKTKLDDPKVREALFKGGAAAIATSKDPMIMLARSIDPDIRKIRKSYEDQIESAHVAAHEKLAEAKFKVYGTNTYPDATFSLRITYGQIKGYQEDQNLISPITVVKNAFGRHTGSDPFALPPSWLKAKNNLNPKTAYNFISTNDIIGGNSGSPVINSNAEIVGVVFDGNVHSLGGAYGFDPKLNRAVSVHSDIMIESLKNVYKASHLINEIQNSK